MREPLENEWFVEATIPDGPDGPRYETLYIGTDVEDAIREMWALKSPYRLEVWSRAWAGTAWGFAPVAYKNPSDAPDA